MPFKRRSKEQFAIDQFEARERFRLKKIRLKKLFAENGEKAMILEQNRLMEGPCYTRTNHVCVDIMAVSIGTRNESMVTDASSVGIDQAVYEDFDFSGMLATSVEDATVCEDVVCGGVLYTKFYGDASVTSSELM
jgi:hypothetical protein